MNLRLAATAALLLVAPAARAESPRWGSFELGAGPWRPNIDSDFPDPGPYESVFGTSRRWAFRFAISKSLYEKAGTLELGLRTGWFRAKGKGLIDQGGTLTPSGDPTTFSVIPLSPTLTYRIDTLPDRWNVPIAPYARVAFERYNWWVTDGSGHSVMTGATNGWSVALGLAFPLDSLDPMMAREIDLDSGVNTTYLYFDATWSSVNDFGSKDSWDLSSDQTAYSIGLLLVF